ncbi:hypothetical protein ACUUL3_04840 [Thiovibrio sp. JS02]
MNHANIRYTIVFRKKQCTDQILHLLVRDMVEAEAISQAYAEFFRRYEALEKNAPWSKALLVFNHPVLRAKVMRGETLRPRDLECLSEDADGA